MCASAQSLNFESPTYTVGALAGQDGWSTVAPTGDGTADNHQHRQRTFGGGQPVRGTARPTSGASSALIMSKTITDLLTLVGTPANGMITFQYDIRWVNAKCHRSHAPRTPSEHPLPCLNSSARAWPDAGRTGGA